MVSKMVMGLPVAGVLGVLGNAAPPLNSFIKSSAALPEFRPARDADGLPNEWLGAAVAELPLRDGVSLRLRRLSDEALSGRDEERSVAVDSGRCRSWSGEKWM